MSAAPEHDVWCLQARQLLLSEERQSAERLERADAARDSGTDILRAEVEAMQTQLNINETTISAAEDREQALLQDLQRAREAQRSTEETLLEAAEGKMQLEAALSEAQAQSEALQSSLQQARAALSAVEVGACDPRSVA